MAKELVFLPTELPVPSAAGKVMLTDGFYNKRPRGLHGALDIVVNYGKLHDDNLTGILVTQKIINDNPNIESTNYWESPLSNAALDLSSYLFNDCKVRHLFLPRYLVEEEIVIREHVYPYYKMTYNIGGYLFKVYYVHVLPLGQNYRYFSSIGGNNEVIGLVRYIEKEHSKKSYERRGFKPRLRKVISVGGDEIVHYSSTPNWSNPHLHLEVAVQYGGRYVNVDPYPYLKYLELVHANSADSEISTHRFQGLWTTGAR